jgi:hypothetical protein
MRARRRESHFESLRGGSKGRAVSKVQYPRFAMSIRTRSLKISTARKGAEETTKD